MIRSHAAESARFVERKQHRPRRIEARARPWCLRLVRIFAQRERLALDLPELLRATRTYFDATLDVQAQRPAAGDGRDYVEVQLSCPKFGYEGRFSIHTRWTSEHDRADARDAEQRGRAAGMATLAERCPTIWDVEALGQDSELARLNLCGILAAVALGPVLPDDGSTLYGVRGAMERVEKLLKTGG